MNRPTNALDRRSLLGATGVIGLAAAGGLALPGRAQASTAVPRFNLAAPFRTLYAKKRLHENFSQQVLAFDSRNRRLFVAQGRRYSTGDDLCLNRVSFTGAPLGTMYVNDCGHGVGFGVEPVGTSSYIWMEARPDSNNRGTALMRFKWVPGTRPANVKYYFDEGRDVSCAIDPVYQRLVVRLIPAGRTGHTHRLYSLPFGHPENMRKLNEFYLPASVAGLGPLAGFAPFGRYLYVFTGRAQRYASNIDSTLATVDMSTSKQVGGNMVTYAGRNLPYREPEGLSVHRGTDNRTRLFFGFASRDSYDGHQQYSNIFYKSLLF